MKGRYEFGEDEQTAMKELETISKRKTARRKEEKAHMLR